MKSKLLIVLNRPVQFATFAVKAAQPNNMSLSQEYLMTPKLLSPLVKMMLSALGSNYLKSIKEGVPNPCCGPL